METWNCLESVFTGQCMVVHDYNAGTWEAVDRETVSSRPVLKIQLR